VTADGSALFWTATAALTLEGAVGPGAACWIGAGAALAVWRVTQRRRLRQHAGRPA
jgi:uncharacterized protein (UPF0548 family)